MRIAISGSTGLIGSALVTVLKSAGHEVVRLVRNKGTGYADGISWDPAASTVDTTALAGTDALIHLAGESIASGRWTESKKARIRDSRVQGTRLLAEAMAQMDQPPGRFLCSSAIGYYGDRGDEILDETSSPGSSFLADVCREWESAADPAREKGLRVVHLRTGVVLSTKDGALAKMLLPFRMGAGGVIGSGKQYWSWIALDDMVRTIQYALTNEGLAGPVNCVAPNPVTNREFTKVLGSVLHRPTFLPMPAVAARLALGEMADELLLASARVVPRRLQETGFEFQHPDLEEALRHELN